MPFGSQRGSGQDLAILESNLAREGIEWTSVDFADNKAVVDAVGGKLGVLDLLDEQAAFPKATDQGFQTVSLRRHVDLDIAEPAEALKTCERGQHVLRRNPICQGLNFERWRGACGVKAQLA